MYKLYAASLEAQEAHEAPTRVRHALKGLALAEATAKRVAAAYVEIRKVLPSGKEALVSVVRGGYLV